jgi:predicted secreted protein
MSQTIGHGSQLELGNGAGGSEIFQPIAGVMSIDLGSNKVDTHDVTDMGTAGTTRVFIGGLENSGDISAKLNVKPGDVSQLALFTAKDGLVHNFKTIYPGAVRTIAFAGIITSLDESVPDDKVPTLTVKIQITGPKTFS